MSMVFIQIDDGGGMMADYSKKGMRIIHVPSSARVLSTPEGWKLEVPGQAPALLPSDVQVLMPWEGKTGRRAAWNDG